MMKLFLMAGLLLSSQSAFAYKIMCRGPFEVIARVAGVSVGGPMIKFAKNAAASGVKGENLGPGTCSWADRIIAANEPNLLLIGISYPEMVPSWSFEYLYHRIWQNDRKDKMVRERLTYLTRSDYVVEFDVLQNTSEREKFFGIIDSDYNDDAYLRLIPVNK